MVQATGPFRAGAPNTPSQHGKTNAPPPPQGYVRPAGYQSPPSPLSSALPLYSTTQDMTAVEAVGNICHGVFLLHQFLFVFMNKPLLVVTPENVIRTALSFRGTGPATGTTTSTTRTEASKAATLFLRASCLGKRNFAGPTVRQPQRQGETGCTAEFCVHWEAYGHGSLPSHNLVSDSAIPHYVSDPLLQSLVGSSYDWTALNLDSERWSQLPYSAIQ